MTTPYGPAALAAFNRAMALASEGKDDEARAVEMLPSDRKVIEAKIEKMAASANTTNE